MRIAHVVSYFQPEFGYEEYFSAREQAALGHEVHVITSDRIFPFKNVDKMLSDIGSPYKDRKRPVGVERMEGFTVHRLRTSFEILYDMIVYKGIEEELARIRPEVVHAHNLWTWGTRCASKAKGKLGYKLIVDEHGYSTTYDQARTFRNFLLDMEYRLLRAPIARRSLRKADEVVAICEETVDFLKDFYHYDRAHLIPLGVDHRRFSFRKDARERTRKELGIEKDEHLLITAGRLDSAKKIEHFIGAVNLMDRHDITFIIVGQGDDKYLGMLRKKAGPRVRFLGFKRSEELADLYCAADLGLWGKASITIREAMGCRLPLVLFDEPNMKDLLKWDNGVYVKQEPDGIAGTITELLDDPVKRKEMGARGRKGVQEELSVEVEAIKLLSLYS
ncbi:MAG: glycosyltransferase family 4 protein [Candidatus Thermoplasmatota archaeon]|nr:glycosyltransferase family 4 protein [Candidatus Thermoplasmatota archaeon]